jgi:hypothetical protein
LAVLLLGAFVACGGEDTPSQPPSGSLGSKCDLAESGACDEGLVCSPRTEADSVCAIAPGETCDADDPDHENGGCAENAECVAREGTKDTVCLTLEGGECDPAAETCTNGLTCAEIEGGGNRCFGEVIFRGEVTDTSDGAAIENAHVIAVDEEGVAVTDVAKSDAMGLYDLAIPAVRDENGVPISAKFTLRAAAQDYQPFPSGVRVALPIDVSEAVPEDKSYVVDSALTDVGLIPLEAAERSQISGKIVALEGDAAGQVGGVLVVATGEDGAFSGLSDKTGNFVIFNVPAGDYQLKAYAADIQIETEDVSVAADPLEGIELAQLAEDTTRVTGNVQIVNAPGGSLTSVILVVEDTFDANAARGEVPRGLRSPKTGEPNVSGDFVIEGVPAGRYVVLAAYENDALVRDPDTNISGTDFVSIEVSAGQDDVTLSESFKVTEALATISPGVDGPEAVDDKPELVWADDSSEDWYDVRVFDAFGTEVWSSLELPGVSGGDTASVQYEGPLEPGMYYQFRVSSWRQPGGGDAAPISTTEDLRGVFFLPAQ